MYKSSAQNQKGIAHVFLIVFLVIAIVIGVVAIQKPDLFTLKSRANHANYANHPAPVSTYPEEGKILQLSEVELAWTQAPNTTYFHIQVIPYNNDGPGANLIVGDIEMVKLSKYKVGQPRLGHGNYILLPGMTYTWRVRTSSADYSLAENASEWGNWSTANLFRTAPPTSATISLQSPFNNSNVSSLNPTLKWDNINDQIFYYEIQLSKDKAFTDGLILHKLIEGQKTIPLNSHTIEKDSPLEANTTYYWRVRPRVQGDGTPVDWTDTSTFKTPAK